MSNAAAYGGLFLASFLAATILPAQSETVFASLLIAGNQPALALLVAASIGNILGSLVNWLLGRGIERFRHYRWFPASPEQLKKAEGFYARWGYWSLLASWVPIIGDPLTVIAGVLGEPVWRFLLLVSVAKVSRYIVLAVLIRQFS